MTLDSINDGLFIVIALLQIVTIATCLVGVSLISSRIMKAHEGDKYYKKTPTVMWFNYFFYNLAAFFIALIIVFFTEAYEIVLLVSTPLTYVSIRTTQTYYKQMSQFRKKTIPRDVIEDYNKQFKDSFRSQLISNIKQSDFKPDVIDKITKRVHCVA